MPRTYQGHIPPASAGWELVKEFSHPEEGDWQIYRQNQAHSTTWATYKAVATSPVPTKANYWFAHDSASGRIGFQRDLTLMQQGRPHLHAAVAGLLVKGA